MAGATLINEKDIRTTPKIYVEWIDSAALRGWQHGSTLTESETDLCKIVSIGFLIRESKDYITISTSVSSGGSTMDPLTIPKVAIKKLRRIKL